MDKFPVLHQENIALFTHTKNYSVPMDSTTQLLERLNVMHVPQDSTAWLELSLHAQEVTTALEDLQHLEIIFANKRF